MRKLRRITLALVVVFSACGFLVPNSARATEPTETTCSQQHVLLLMDESGSLKRTDPNGRRVDAAELLVEALSPAEVDRAPVSLTVAGFGTSYTEYGRFALPGDRQNAISEVERFRQRNGQLNTDYVVALRSAAAYFATVDAPLECKTLIWFTDGGHDLEHPEDPNSQVPTYSSATDPGEITRQLMGLVCGPLPPGSPLAQPVRSEIRDAGFRTVISELEIAAPTPREKDLLAITHPVLQRLVKSPGDDCAVPGAWEIVSQPAQLAANFVEQAQRAVGANSIPCALLTSGALRADIVKSIAFRVDGSAAATLQIGSESIRLSGHIIDRDIPPAARAAGLPISVTAETNLLDCYAHFDVELRFRSEPVLFRGAVRIRDRAGRGRSQLRQCNEHRLGTGRPGAHRRRRTSRGALRQ